MEFLHNIVQAHCVGISAGILLVAYVFIALEKIPKVTIALLGAAITILLGLVSQTKTLDGGLDPHYFINFVDFNVIFLLVSMMIIVSIATQLDCKSAFETYKRASCRSFNRFRFVYGSSFSIFG